MTKKACQTHGVVLGMELYMTRFHPVLKQLLHHTSYIAMEISTVILKVSIYSREVAYKENKKIPSPFKVL